MERFFELFLIQTIAKYWQKWDCISCKQLRKSGNEFQAHTVFTHKKWQASGKDGH